MSILLSHIKAYGLAIVAAVVGVLVATVKILSARNSQLSRRAEYAEEKARRAAIIADADIEIERAKRIIREEQKDTDNPGFNDPNKLWGDKDDT